MIIKNLISLSIFIHLKEKIMNPLIASLLTTVLGTLNTVISLLNIIPGAGSAIVPIQTAIASITSALNIVHGLPV